MTMTDGCWACSHPFTSWRLLENPAWGTDTATGQPRREIDFLNDRPDQAVRACEQHKAVRVTNGQPDPVAPRGGPEARTNWAQRRKNQTRELRAQVIGLLGGECKQCHETEPDLLCISVRPGLWSGLAITDKQERLRWLLQRLDYGVVLCVDHLVSAPVLNMTTRTNREQVVEAYGGKCSVCGSGERLGIVAGPNAPRLRWSGGQKYSSREKLSWLVRGGFPKGWSLRCPRHTTST